MKQQSCLLQPFSFKCAEQYQVMDFIRYFLLHARCFKCYESLLNYVLMELLLDITDTEVAVAMLNMQIKISDKNH